MALQVGSVTTEKINNTSFTVTFNVSSVDESNFQPVDFWISGDGPFDGGFVAQAIITINGADARKEYYSFTIENDLDDNPITVEVQNPIYDSGGSGSGDQDPEVNLGIASIEAINPNQAKIKIGLGHATQLGGEEELTYKIYDGGSAIFYSDTITVGMTETIECIFSPKITNEKIFVQATIEKNGKEYSKEDSIDNPFYTWSGIKTPEVTTTWDEKLTYKIKNTNNFPVEVWVNGSQESSQLNAGKETIEKSISYTTPYTLEVWFKACESSSPSHIETDEGEVEPDPDPDIPPPPEPGEDPTAEWVGANITSIEAISSDTVALKVSFYYIPNLITPNGDIKYSITGDDSFYTSGVIEDLSGTIEKTFSIKPTITTSKIYVDVTTYYIDEEYEMSTSEFSPFAGGITAPTIVDATVVDKYNVKFKVKNTNSFPVKIYVNGVLQDDELDSDATSEEILCEFESYLLNFNLAVAFSACNSMSQTSYKVFENEDPTNSDSEETKIENDVTDPIYLKDVTPEFLDSDRSGTGFTDTNRLKELLSDWGLESDVSQVTLWKISTVNQYQNDGPRLEWQGNLFVRATRLHLLKCKNKDHTKYQLCSDLHTDNWLLLNTGASSYSNADWKWIHITELGFAMRQTCAFLRTRDEDEYEYFKTGFFMKSKDKDIYHKESYIIYTGTNVIEDSTIPWPWKNYYVPGYGVKGKALNGTGFVLAPNGQEEFYKYVNKIGFRKNSESEANYFLDNPEKMNFTNNYLNSYEWLYQDFDHKYTGYDGYRRNNSTYLFLNYSGGYLTLSGSATLTSDRYNISQIKFNKDADICWLFFRDPTANCIEKPMLNAELKNSGNDYVVEPKFQEGKNTFEFKASNVQYKLLEVWNNNYIFTSNGYCFESDILTTYPFSDLPDIKNTLNIESDSWGDIAKKFIVEWYDDDGFSTYINTSINTVSDSSWLGWSLTYSFPQSIGYTIKIKNLQGIKGVAQPNLSDYISSTAYSSLSVNVKGLIKEGETKMWLTPTYSNKYNGLLAANIESDYNPSEDVVSLEGFDETRDYYVNTNAGNTPTAIGILVMRHKVETSES